MNWDGAADLGTGVRGGLRSWGGDGLGTGVRKGVTNWGGGLRSWGRGFGAMGVGSRRDKGVGSYARKKKVRLRILSISSL